MIHWMIPTLQTMIIPLLNGNGGWTMQIKPPRPLIQPNNHSTWGLGRSSAGKSTKGSAILLMKM